MSIDYREILTARADALAGILFRLVGERSQLQWMETEATPRSEPGYLLLVSLFDEILIVGIDVDRADAESGGESPTWLARLDSERQKFLDQMAHDVGVCLISHAPSAAKAAYVADLKTATQRAERRKEYEGMSATYPCEDYTLRVSFRWPVPDEIVLPTTRETRVAYSTIGEGLRTLPPYSRSLLRVPLNVTATLASTREPIKKIVELAPGSLIQFNKSCEETISLEVGGHRIALGEAVKVGERFGVRITSIALPAERFHPVKSRPLAS